MAVTQTSMLAYKSIKKDLGLKQQIILGTLKSKGNLTNAELSRVLRLPINTVTPRVKELRELGLVEEKAKKNDTVTNRLSTVWGVV